MIRPAAWPGILFVLAVLTAITATGLASLRFDDDYKAIFRGSDGRYKAYLAFLERFPAEERNLLAVVHGPVLSARGVRALLDLEEALFDHPAVVAVYLPVTPPRLRTLAERFIASGDPDTLAHLVARATRHPVLSRGMLSADGDTALVVAALRDRFGEPGPVVESVHQSMAAVLEPAGIGLNLGGIPAVRAALKSQVRHDQFLFDALAAILATGVALWLFRSARVVAAAAIGPVLGVWWTLGAMGLAGLSINVLTQMVAALVLVVGYTDAVHVTTHLRESLARGLSGADAARRAWRDIGPACLVTSLTTAAGFASLLLSDAWMIRQFGLVCALGSLTVFAAVMLSVPLTARVIASAPNHARDRTLSIDILRRLRRHPAAVVVAGLVVSAILVLTAIQVRPDYAFKENLPRGHDVRAAFERADRELGGLLPITVVVNIGPGASAGDLVGAAGLVANRLRDRTGLAWLGIADFAALVPLDGVDALPDALRDDLLDAEAGMTVVSTVLPDHGARATVDTIGRVRAALSDLDAGGGAFDLEITGIAALAATGSRHMIADLGRSLATAAAAVFAVIALLLRSVRLGLVSLVPNVAPIAMVAAMLVWLGEPLSYACVLVFTICLGLAVDDTVHVIMRFRRERAAGRDVDSALDATLGGTGRVLIATTLILAAGFAALTASATPMVVLLGALSCLAIVTALVFDLTFLPALLALTATGPPSGGSGR